MTTLELWLFAFQIGRDHARPFIRAGRAARRIDRRDDGDKAAVVHRLDLAPQQFDLRSVTGPGVRQLRCRRFVVAVQRVETQIDAGRDYQLVEGELVAGRQRHAVRLRIHRGR